MTNTIWGITGMEEINEKGLLKMLKNYVKKGDEERADYVYEIYKIKYLKEFGK